MFFGSRISLLIIGAVVYVVWKLAKRLLKK